MQETTTDATPRVLLKTWDRTIRWFHWVNLACIVVLSTIGTAILFEDDLGLSGPGIILLKTVHVYVGYVFALNLLWRLIWAFTGSAHARWKALLPFRSGYFADLRAFVNGTKWIAETPEAGHNPLGRLMITLLLVLMTAQASTGLILAGTDLYKPPLGGWVAEWVTDGDASRLAQLQPGSRDFVVAEKYAEMRAFRKPYKNIHEILFYVLAGAIVLHIIGVILFEFRSKQGLVSAMITGKKSLPRSSQDETPP